MISFKAMKEKIFGAKAEDYQENYIENGRIISIQCDAIRPSRAQPRADFDEDNMARLVNSVKMYGVIRPLLVRKTDIDDIYDYELISGERRLRAARLSGMYSVPCIVLDADSRTAAEMIMTDELTAQRLNMFEVAYGLRALCEDHDADIEEISRRLSVSKAKITNKLRLLELSYKEQRAALALSLSEKHALLLLRLGTHEARMSVMYRIADKDMSIRETEKYIEKLLGETPVRSVEEMIEESDRSVASLIRAVQKRLELFNKSSERATLELNETERSIEITVTISK